MTHYVNWAQNAGHDPDEVATLKRYEREKGVGRAHTNYLADQLYIGGGESDWRKQSAYGPRGPFDKEKRYYDDTHREDMVRDLNAADDDEARAMAEEDGHLRTERRQGLVGEGALNDGSSTDGKIVGQCPGCDKPIRKHKTAHGDELRHLHNNHVRCFGKTGVADVPPGEGSGLPGSLKAAEVGGDMLNSAEHELEKPPDMWAYRAESALQMYADYLGRPDAANPTGRGPDEYKARTWNAYETTRPMQSLEDRNINTPVLPSDPIKTRNINTPTRGLQGREDDLRHSEDDDDDDED